MKRIGGKPTTGKWRVAEGLPDRDADANGCVVVCDNPVLIPNTVIADCRNGYLPIMQQMANARACAAAKEAIEILIAVESYLGDLPARDRTASKLHRQVVALLQGVL